MAPGCKTELRNVTNTNQANQPSHEGDAVRVFVRVRPLAEGPGSAEGEQSLCLSVLSPTTLRLHSNPEPKTFTFDHVADMDVTQESVFSTVAKNIVESCMSGYNGTIFAYGQTGSGKTFTMMGPSESDNFSHNLRGVIPRSFEYLFFLIDREKEKAGTGKSFLCKCSFIEIYNEQIFDLLDPASAGLYLREHIKKGVFLVGAVEQAVTSAAEAYQVLSGGWRNRRVASTSMNRESSRSHAVFTITIESLEKSHEAVNLRTSLLNMVDLAGSERQKDTHTEGVRLKAVVNEDTQGNVSQLQAEIKRLKEQLAQCISGQIPPESSLSRVTDAGNTSYADCFREAMLFFKKSEQEKKALIEKVTQLEDLTIKKEKFIQSNKMIVKFREDQIMRLEKLHKESRGSFLPAEQDRLLSELRDEIQTLREQIEHHPRVAKYAMENQSLREENRRLRVLEPVKKAQEMDAQAIAKLEKAFSDVCNTEGSSKGQPRFSCKAPGEQCSLANTEKLKAQLLQIQTELNNSKQEYEEFKELTRRKQLELESELQSLQKANLNLENILEATKVCKRQEVSQLNKIHAETIKIITTPTKAYQIRSRPIPRLSLETPTGNTSKLENDIFNEPIPPAMSEQALEAISEELRVVQEQMNCLQVTLDETEHKNVRLQQQIDKLEHHSAQMQELFLSERTDWTKQQQDSLEQLNALEKQLRETQTKNDFLKSEVHDLRVVLQSADKELSSVKLEYSSLKERQEKELNQLSERHMHVQLQLDNVRLENEKLLERKACLQDSYDNLQEEMKFEMDQLTRNLQTSTKDNETLKSDLKNLMELFEAEKERNNKLLLQFEEDKENSSKEILKALETVRQEKQKVLAKCEEQGAKVQKLEESLLASEKVVSTLEKSRNSDKEVVGSLMSQIQELRASLAEQTETADSLKQELKDIHHKYNSALADKEEGKALIKAQEGEILDLKEALRLRKLSEDIERDMLCEDLAHATEQLNMLTEASKKHSGLLQSAQAELTRKEALIQELQHKLQEKRAEVEQRKNEYNLKMRQLGHVMESAADRPQSPKTPPHFQTHLAKLLETQEQEIEDGRASTISLRHLVTQLNEDREAKSAAILRMKEQLREMENVRLEVQQLREQNWRLQGQLEDMRHQEDGSEQDQPASQPRKGEQDEVTQERLDESKLVEEMQKMKTHLAEVQSALQDRERGCRRMAEEVERTRTLESKAFQEKEQLRSKLEEMYEERERTFQEMEMLKKQMECLAEENGKLVGHQNHQQKIQYVVRLKKENVRLVEETEKLRAENIFLKDKKRSES
ncbi:kinesin-like protein KIF15 isoform X2 [Tenrec ecaudatus]|uniref:kinesin-like protein KIF15 isoform X2 n=1 Tax=Tenrec ecaudatus TaxID=94439 RepID=UPI003F5AB21A